MSDLLHTRNIFLDTEVFVHANFSYNSQVMLEFKKLAQSGKIVFYTTHVTRKEIEGKIKDAVKEAKRGINQIQKEGRILRNCIEPSFRNIFDFRNQETEAHLAQQLGDFFSSCLVKIISVDKVSINSVFDRYFNHKPPFSEGRKKLEFPDAFVLAALEKWCKDNEEIMYVVSNDKDHMSFCNESELLISASKVEEVLQLAVSEDGQLRVVADELFAKHLADIHEAVEENFSNHSFYVEDADGDVDDITIIRTELLERYLVSTDEDNLRFEASFAIEYTAGVTFNDPDFTVYDKESGDTYVFETSEKSVRSRVTIPVEVVFTLDRQNVFHSQIDEITVSLDNAIFISVFE